MIYPPAPVASPAPPNIHVSPTLPHHVGGDALLPSWHPKITPYRFFMLITTITLGTAKAVLTERGSTLAPVMVEWLAGTVLCLLFFSVSAYDSKENIPGPISWLFEPDCMDLVWPFLEIFSIRRPPYISEEKQVLVSHSEHPPITPYRILVCSAVASFGVSKAAMGYYGLSTAVTWTDWALAVPITTLFYILGLYEYNSLGVWSAFFILDYSDPISTGLNFIIGMTLSSGCTVTFGYLLRCCYNEPDCSFLNAPHPPHDKITFMTHVEDWAFLAWRLVSLQCTFLAMIGSIVALFSVSGPVFTFVAGLLRRVLCATRRLLVHKAAIIVTSAAEEALQAWEQPPSRYDRNFIITRLPLSRIIIHTALHLLAMSGCFAYAISSLFGLLVLVDNLLGRNVKTFLANFFTFLICVFPILCLTWCCVYAFWGLTYSLLAPVLYHLKGRPWSDGLFNEVL